jgi:ketosteroid isomerase-like protein
MEAGLAVGDAGATPEAISRAFAAAVAARDPEAAGACLSGGGCLLTPDGTEVCGKPQVREVLAQLAAIHTEIRIELGRVLSTGATAVGSQQWTLCSKGSPSKPFEQTHAAVLVLAREQQGWRVSIVAPWGL